jgi:hypothetical protein
VCFFYIQKHRESFSSFLGVDLGLETSVEGFLSSITGFTSGLGSSSTGATVTGAAVTGAAVPLSLEFSILSSFLSSIESAAPRWKVFKSFAKFSP